MCRTSKDLVRDTVPSGVMDVVKLLFPVKRNIDGGKCPQNPKEVTEVPVA